MESPPTGKQALLDAILPAFLTATRPSAEAGSTYVTLRDLCLSEPVEAGDGAPDARAVEGPAPKVDPRAATLLPAGSVLRFVDWWPEMYGVGHCAAVHHHLRVETGPLAGSRVAFADIDRWLVSGSVARRTMAAALLAPAGTSARDLPGLLESRRATIRSIGTVGPSLPVHVTEAGRPHDSQLPVDL